LNDAGALFLPSVYNQTILEILLRTLSCLFPRYHHYIE
jgi:hypothetical protein